MSDDDEKSGSSTAATAAAVVLPFATAAGALVIGALLGGVIAWVAKPPVNVEIKVPRDLTPEELVAACAPQVSEKASELQEANNKVNTLQDEVTVKSARVAELEGEMEKRSKAGASLVKERNDLAAQLEAARAELESVKAQLTQAVAEKEALTQKLAVTEAALADQKVQTDRAKEDALTNKWERFKNDAQLEICEKGGRKKMDNCRETVLAKLGTPDVRDKFTHCVRSAQAVPTVVEMTDKAGTLPSFSQWLDQEDKVTKDWYLLLCDPTLPESDGFLNEQHLPGGAQ